MRDAALLIDTLRLASPADTGALATAWASADADALVRLATFEGGALWLQRRLKALGITLAGEAGKSLAATARREAAHALRTESEAFATLGILDAAGITAIALKGAAMRRIASRVPYADARAPNDLDALVRDDEAQRAWDALVAQGYVPPKAHGPADGHHLPALVGPLGVGVEIHLTTSPYVPPAEAWRRATSGAAMADFDGIMRPVPSDTELFWHTTAHAVAQAEEHGREGARLRYWLDASALLAAAVPIDWERIRARIAAHECANPAFVRAWIRTASDLSGRSLPTAALGDSACDPLDLERLMSWRLRVFERYAPDGRWAERLIEEGARGEARLPHEPAHHGSSPFGRVRHTVAARAARVWWRMRR